MKLFAVIISLTFYSIKFNTEIDPAQIPIKTIVIGGKTWTAENFSSNISTGTCYENDPMNCMTSGRLYSFEAAVRNAPKGWHLPTKDEWHSLIAELKKNGQSPYEVLTTGEFNIRFAGFKDSFGDFTKKDYEVRFWTSTPWGTETNQSWYVYLSKSRQIADLDTDEKKCLFSVRYVKD